MNELDDEVVEHLLGDISFVESQKFSISLLFFLYYHYHYHYDSHYYFLLRYSRHNVHYIFHKFLLQILIALKDDEFLQLFSLYLFFSSKYSFFSPTFNSLNGPWFCRYYGAVDINSQLLKI